MATLPAPAWLTEFEKTTVAGFSGQRRQEYLTSRWLIRRSLAGISGTAPADCRPVDGRPVCSRYPPGWHLSLSHSRGLSACAVSALPGLGLDIEPGDRYPDWPRVVQRWFTPREQSWLLRNESSDHFLRVWTLKEAWLKATGRGIAGNLKTLEVGADYSLSGDRNDQEWVASAGRAGDFLVALVYPRCGNSLPSGGLVQPPGPEWPVDQPAAVMSPVNWLFHHSIGVHEQE